MKSTELKSGRVSQQIRLKPMGQLCVSNRDDQCMLVLQLGRGLSSSFTTMMLSSMGRDRLVTALLDWRYVQDELPESNETLLIACDGPAVEEPASGFYSGGEWYYQNAEPVNYPVYAWAHKPALPPKKGRA